MGDKINGETMGDIAGTKGIHGEDKSAWVNFHSKGDTELIFGKEPGS
jgi:hypothetical protein